MNSIIMTVVCESLNCCFIVVCLCAQVRTLFVSGLPMDARPRELYLLFQGYKVYDALILHRKPFLHALRCCDGFDPSGSILG